MGGDSSGLQGVGLFADWELDLWGRVRSSAPATTAGYESVVADTEYARQSVAALVAKSYFLAVEATLQLRLAEDTVATSQQLVTFAEQRQRVGRGDGYDTALARANVETFRDTVEKLRLVARAGAARARGAGRPISGGGCRGRNATREAAGARARRPAFRTARAAAGRRGRRHGASPRRSMASRKPRRPGCPRISLTASVNDISSELFVLRNSDNPVWSVGAQPAAADFQRRRAADAGPHPHGRAEAGHCRVRPHRRARVRGGRGRAVGRVRRGPARGRARAARSPRTRRRLISRSSASRSAPATCGPCRSSNSPCSARSRRCCECSPSGSSSASTCTWPWAADSTRRRQPSRLRRRRSES